MKRVAPSLWTHKWLLVGVIVLALAAFGPAVAFAAPTSISPTTAQEGAASFTLTVNGTGFNGTSQVTWTPPGGSARTLTRLSQTTTKLTATVLSSDLPYEGTAGVRVTQTGGSGAGGPINFTITEADSFTLTPQSIAATSNVAFSGTVATLNDSFDNQLPSRFVVSINWGDGTGASTGTATRTDVGTYDITGSHTYTAPFQSTSVKTVTAYPAATIPTANNGNTNFPTSGSLVVFTGTGYQTVTYTGKTTGTSASFTGVTGWTGSGTLAVGNPVSQAFNAATVTVTDPSPGTATATTTSPVAVADGMTYTMGVSAFSTTEGQTYTGSTFFPGSIGTSVFPSTGLYRLLVSNGTSSAWYTLYTSGPNNYMYPNSTPGSLAFPTVGQVPYSETLYLNSGVPVASGASTVTVNDAGLSYFSAVNVYSSVEGTSTGSIQVGKFIDGYIGGGNHASDFTCTIHWGDGSSDTGVPAVFSSSNQYTVSGSHTYSEEGTYTVTYDVADYGGSNLTGISTCIVGVSDPPVQVTGVAPITGVQGTPLGTQDLATFTDPGGAEPNDGTHYAASVDWGGSFGTSVGSISFVGGTFTVSASIPYATAGTYYPVVTVSHELSAPQSVADTVTIQLPPPNDITSSAGPHGTISPDGVTSVVWGTDQTYTFAPDPGYHVDTLTIDGGSAEATTATSYTFSDVTAPHTIHVTFAIDTFTITSTAFGHGTVAPVGDTSVDYGGSYTCTFTPDLGYHIAAVVVDSVPLTGVLPDHVTFDNVDAGHTVAVTFSINTYTITPSVNGDHGTTDPAVADTSVPYGANWAVNFIPDPHYHVATVSIDGGSAEATTATGYQFENVAADHTVAVTYAIDTYTISVAPSTNGTITPPGDTVVDWNGSQTFTVTPDTGYHIVDVTVDGDSKGAVGTYTFDNVAANHTIAATFAINTYTITVTPSTNGTITPPGDQTVDYNGSKTFTITPDTGYHIVDVTVDSASKGAVGTYTFDNVTANHTIAATFAINTYTITPSVNGDHGTTDPGSAFSADYGSSATVTFTPDAHYHVSDVTVDGTSLGTTPDHVTFSGIAADHTVAVTFAIDTYTISVAPSSNGTITPPGNQTVGWGGSKTFTVTPDTGYHIVDVKEDGVSIGTSSSVTFDNVTANHTLSATFAIDTYTISVAPSTNGTITPPGDQTVNYNGSKTFTITPNTGYHIVDVTVDSASQGAVGTYTFDNVVANHAIAATFAINTYTITPSVSGGHGTTTPATVVTKDYGSSQTVTITPDTGYQVNDVLVDGSSVGSVGTYTFSNIQGNHTIVASFSLLPNWLPVWRFRSTTTIGSYLWTADPTEKANIIANLSKSWIYEGQAFNINTNNPKNNSPLWRFRNLSFWTYFYTADPNEKANVIANLSPPWFFEGPTWNVSTDSVGTQPVWRFRCLKNATHLWTSDPNEKTTIINTLKSTYAYEGVAYYIGQ